MGLSRKNIICIGCPKGCRITIDYNQEITDISGYECQKGKEYAQKEFQNPTRILPTTVKVINGELPLVSVKTERGIPKEILLSTMQEIAKIEVEAPIRIGQIIKSNIMNTGINLLATRNIRRSNEKLTL